MHSLSLTLFLYILKWEFYLKIKITKIMSEIASNLIKMDGRNNGSPQGKKGKRKEGWDCTTYYHSRL